MILFWEVLVDFVVDHVHRDEWQQFGVDDVCLRLCLEVHLEHAFEFADANQTLFVLNELVELLLEIVENSIIHCVPVDLPKYVMHFAFVTASLLHHLLEVVVHKLRPHRLRSLCLTLALQILFQLLSLR